MATVFQNGVRFRCLGVRQSPLEKKSVIGLSWLRNNYIIFDKEHNRIGIGTKSATYPEQDLFKPTDQSPSVSLVDAKPTTNQPKQQQPPEVKDCGVHVSHSMIATSKMDNEQVSHWIFTISNKKDTPLNNLKMVWSNNLVSLEIGYNFVTHELQPPMDIPAKTDFSFHYIARGMDPIFVGFPDLMECNEYNYDVSITRSVNIQAEEKEQSKVLQSIHRNNTEGIEYSGPAQKPVSKEIEQSRQEFSSLDVPCSLKYNQHKGYQWRDSDGGTVTWYEVDIVNQSNSTFVTSLIVSTLDSIVNVIGMDMEVTPEKSTILSLPKNVTIIPHEDYRWVYATRQTSSVSYSLVHPVVCNTA
ncbi:hypothetical protein DFA_07388 [Cavenderia fasciculata]|uniref:Peptidase A1 domain-containing protein n=1 Tax=Cavenderia fasciculata TaxID=261658 RepID=F4PWA1_CACFS|nr:uncharacterized protein DFA_07388 [Cavenderia fasciculata]EGG20265.1 hypothetical protein DFA_07388 [Cavenderia fasciculata]|eukprot:XP_004367248.1 hypothetical protein DFA_07388 [Cavenderia fasciculata]